MLLRSTESAKNCQRLEYGNKGRSRSSLKHFQLQIASKLFLERDMETISSGKAGSRHLELSHDGTWRSIEDQRRGSLNAISRQLLQTFANVHGDFPDTMEFHDLPPNVGRDSRKMSEMTSRGRRRIRDTAPFRDESRDLRGSYRSNRSSSMVDRVANVLSSASTSLRSAVNCTSSESEGGSLDRRRRISGCDIWILITASMRYEFERQLTLVQYVNGGCIVMRILSHHRARDLSQHAAWQFMTAY